MESVSIERMNPKWCPSSSSGATLGEGDGDGEGEGDADGDAEGVGDAVSLGDGEAVTLGVPGTSTSSVEPQATAARTAPESPSEARSERSRISAAYPSDGRP